MNLRRPAHGFTLIEMIVSIVILGIVAGIVAVFIRAPILGYRDTVDRAEITDQADLSLRRMAREIRLALPNSVRVNGDGSAVEFLQTRSGGRYLTVDELAPTVTEQAFALRFGSAENGAQPTFSALVPSSFAQVNANTDYVVVYNVGPGSKPVDAYTAPDAGGGNIAAIRKVAAATHTLADGTTTLATTDITLASNPFAAQSPPLPSPGNRFQVISGPVSFYCKAAGDGTLQLWRAWGYAISAAQQAPPADANTKTAMVASRLTRCTNIFNYSTAANQRTGLVGIDLALRGRYDSAQAIRLLHQVHVDNTP
jgi:MSHA biogenesis protein MshO